LITKAVIPLIPDTLKLMGKKWSNTKKWLSCYRSIF